MYRPTYLPLCQHVSSTHKATLHHFRISIFHLIPFACELKRNRYTDCIYPVRSRRSFIHTHSPDPPLCANVYMCKFKLKDSVEYYDDEDLPIDIMIIIFRALNLHLHIYTSVFELHLFLFHRFFVVAVAFFRILCLCRLGYFLITVTIASAPLLLLIFHSTLSDFFSYRLGRQQISTVCAGVKERKKYMTTIFDIQTSCLHFSRQTNSTPEKKRGA